MAEVSQLKIETALKEYPDAYLETDLVSAKAVRNIEVDGGKVRIDIVLGYPAKGYRDELIQALKEHIGRIEGVTDVQVDVTWEVTTHAVQQGVKPIKGVKNIIAVASGKGGVGKSTTAANLALALAAEGAKVGILDADIYGPSQPRMFNLHQRPDSKDGKSLEPLISYNVQCMSIGFLIEEDTPMIWRGPMVTQALEQLINDTNWQDLDYLVIDLPPGTGDIHLTLAQKIPVSGSVIITTPQDIALTDAVKGMRMFEKVDVPVLGIVENMSLHICSQCGHEEHIFGEGGAQTISEKYGVEVLGMLPLDIRIREEADNGRPSVVTAPDSRIAQIYRQMARRIGAKLSQRDKDYSGAFPDIVIQND